MRQYDSSQTAVNYTERARVPTFRPVYLAGQRGFDQLANCPNMIGRALCHSWRDPQRLVNSAEIV